jgi:hypothetical protein
VAIKPAYSFGAFGFSVFGSAQHNYSRDLTGGL